jgi:hypothetical protein
MRVPVAPALIALLLPFSVAGCTTSTEAPAGSAPWVNSASGDEVAKVVDGIGGDEAAALARVGGAPGIVRTPDGATLLWWSVAAMEGERSASAWMVFSPAGKLVGSQSMDQFSPADPAAYDGGFVMAGPPAGDSTNLRVVSESGKIDTSKPVLPHPLRVLEGDVLLAGYGASAFHPREQVFAPIPVAKKDPLGGTMPTVIDGSGAITSIAGTVRKPVLLYSPSGGLAWQRKPIELPKGLTIEADRLLTGPKLTLLPLVNTTQELAGWITRGAGKARWTVTTFSPDFADSWAMGLVGDRVLIGPFDDSGGTLVTVADPSDRTEIKRDALRASGGNLYSMSPKVTESTDGTTWTDVPLKFPKG